MSFSICGTVGGNIGSIDCDVRRGRPVGIIVGSAVFVAADYASSATFQTALLTKVKSAAGSASKLFPFPSIQTTNDKTDAPKEGTYGYGLKQILLQGLPAYEFIMIPGTTQEKKMRQFHNKTVPVFVFDDAGNVWGVGDTSGNFFGATCLISVIGKGFEDGQNVKGTTVQISYVNAGDFYDSAYFMSTTFSISSLKALNDGIVAPVAVNSTNVFHLGIKIPTAQIGNSVDVHLKYPTELSSSALWAAFTGVNFATTHTLTTVANDTTNGGWTVTLDTTQFGALASGAQVKIGLVAPGVLDAAGVTELESVPYIYTKP